jgi:uncharacterized protein with HEPN domain
MLDSDKIRLKHILDSILEIESFTSEIGLDNFKQNRLIRNATVRSFEIIGEAVSALTDDFKSKNQFQCHTFFYFA